MNRWYKCLRVNPFIILVPSARTLPLSFLLFLPVLAFAQSFTGIVTDSQSKAPLPYASIGVKGKSIGGIADINGHFLIDITKALPTDTIVVSYLGYQAKTLVKGNVSHAAYQIKLVSSPFQLHEVVTISKRELLSIGNRKAGGHYTGWGDYASSKGRLRGTAIDTDELPLQLVSFNLHLSACEFDSVRFRLHILPQQASHSSNPTAELLHQNIFFTAHRDQKWVSVDLTPYHLIIRQPILVAVEWVDSWIKTGGSHLLTISTSRKEGYTYTRDTPEAPFQIVSYPFTPTMYVEAYRAGQPATPSRP